MITWKESKGKYVIRKDGAYMSFTVDQLIELSSVIDEMKMTSSAYRLKIDELTDNYQENIKSFYSEVDVNNLVVKTKEELGEKYKKFK